MHARADLKKKTNVLARAWFYLVSFIYGHPVLAAGAQSDNSHLETGAAALDAGFLAVFQRLFWSSLQVQNEVTHTECPAVFSWVCHIRQLNSKSFAEAMVSKEPLREAVCKCTESRGPWTINPAFFATILDENSGEAASWCYWLSEMQNVKMMSSDQTWV